MIDFAIKTPGSNSMDAIDFEAMREGDAIKRLGKRKRKDRKCACTRKGKAESDLDILRILNIIQDNKHDVKQPQRGDKRSVSET